MVSGQQPTWLIERTVARQIACHQVNIAARRILAVTGPPSSGVAIETLTAPREHVYTSHLKSSNHRSSAMLGLRQSCVTIRLRLIIMCRGSRVKAFSLILSGNWKCLSSGNHRRCEAIAMLIRTRAVGPKKMRATNEHYIASLFLSSQSPPTGSSDGCGILRGDLLQLLHIPRTVTVRDCTTRCQLRTNNGSTSRRCSGKVSFTALIASS
ncbi:hypothetical protein C8Q74DRAFT_400838 [Fomes fomentarius]|nr:hypothetical protein C8Q74DRAFT_400838 [Fomes fomentarius]